MSAPAGLADDGGVISSSERFNQSYETSCIARQSSLNLLNGQGSCLSNSTDGFRVGECRLPNGDMYLGTMLGSMSEGSGKYVWPDGCSYDGEWHRGMRHGRGKLSWPSGAVYEGDFSGGYMHGSGTYRGSDRLTYKGHWKLSLKHGLGHQTYPNGDVFDGSWIQGMTQGPGKYIWANQNVYIGTMKAGKMSGKGTLTWKNGDMYEGNWSEGMMHGYGVYTWNDGDRYIGTWTRGLKDGKGSFYPKGSKIPAVQELYINALIKRGLLPDLKRQNHGSHLLHSSSSVDMGSMKVSERQLSSSSSSGNLYDTSRNRNVTLERRRSLKVAIKKVIGNDSSLATGESISGSDDKMLLANVPIIEREYMQGVLISELVINDKFSSSSRRDRRLQKKLKKEIQRPGETIIKGHRSYDLMLCLQLGIRYTVGKNTPIQRREVRASNFGPRASFGMEFPKAGSQLTPPHHSEDFKWKDYCPMVFRNLREMFKIDAADYMMSICGNAALRELSSPGKSGSVFFLSQDDRFMIKTLRKSEVQVLLRMLPNYHHHVRTYENTLIAKFFGLHRVKPSSGQKFRFVVMGNMFCTELRIHKRFDLKGSSLGRSSDNIEIDENTTLKDLDLNYCFYLEPSWRDALLMQIEIDSRFLETQHIMDYSLLLGVHYRAPQHLRSRELTILSEEGVVCQGCKLRPLTDAQDEEISNYNQGLVLVPRGTDENSVVVGPHIRGSRLRAPAAGDEEVDLLLPGTARFQIQLGVNMPARAEHFPAEDGTQVFHKVYDVVLYVGIIDILQEYNITKKIEHAYKSLKFDSISISAVDPQFYSERFLKFISNCLPRKLFGMILGAN